MSLFLAIRKIKLPGNLGVLQYSICSGYNEQTNGWRWHEDEYENILNGKQKR